MSRDASDPVLNAWTPASRIALYYAPPSSSAWWRAGCEWLGRDAETGSMIETPGESALTAFGHSV